VGLQRPKQKQLIRWFLVAVLVADVALAAVNWEIAAAPRAPEVELTSLRQQRALLAADVARARQIRADLPAVGQQGDKFFHQQMAPAETGYSAVIENLGELARAADVRTDNVTFRQNTPDKRGVIEVEIGATLNGDYPSIVRFINGLERSDTFYVLDGLTLAAGSTGDLRLNLRLRTYFRTVE
jgi:Tfp pilus assembly protein PilO